jgi:hypothetical protein
MMKKTVAVPAAVTAIALGLGANTLATAEPSARGAERGRPPEVIRLVERVHEVAFDDGGAPGPSLGDRLIFTAEIFDEQGRRVGRDGADCVVVRNEPSAPPTEQQVVECMVSLELPEGQLTFQGLAQGLDNTFALTGGTGAYRTAQGEAVVRDRVFLEEAEITITLIR